MDNDARHDCATLGPDRAVALSECACGRLSRGVGGAAVTLVRVCAALRVVTGSAAKGPSCYPFIHINHGRRPTASAAVGVLGCAEIHLRLARLLEARIDRLEQPRVIRVGRPQASANALRRRPTRRPPWPVIRDRRIPRREARRLRHDTDRQRWLERLEQNRLQCKWICPLHAWVVTSLCFFR